MELKEFIYLDERDNWEALDIFFLLRMYTVFIIFHLQVEGSVNYKAVDGDQLRVVIESL